MIVDGDDWRDYDSGPYCRHWSDPVDCEERCVCGHRCGQHYVTDDGFCSQCSCEEWREVVDGPP